MKRLFYLGFVAVIAMSSCTMYQDVEVLEVNDVRVTEFSNEVIRAEVDLKVKNPNWYAIRLTKSEVDLTVNENELGKLNLGEKVKLAPKAVSYNTLKVEADYEDISGNFLQNMLGLIFKPKIDFKAEGYIKAKALIFGKKVPIKIEEQVDPSDINIGG